MPVPPVPEEPMPNPGEEEEPGMPPMMPGEEESGMMPPMMPGEEESGMAPMMPGDDMGMMPMPTPPPMNPMDTDVLNQWIGICKEFCTCQSQGTPVFPCSCEPSNSNFDACGNLLNALQLICINNVPNTIPCPLEF